MPYGPAELDELAETASALDDATPLAEPASVAEPELEAVEAEELLGVGVPAPEDALALFPEEQAPAASITMVMITAPRRAVLNSFTTP